MWSSWIGKDSCSVSNHCQLHFPVYMSRLTWFEFLTAFRLLSVHYRWVKASAGLVCPVLRTGGAFANSSLDTSTTLAFPRIHNLLEDVSVLSSLYHYQIPSLAHLFVLLRRSQDSFPPAKTSVLVLDDVSTLFSRDFPLGIES